jgi:ubiquinone/menaquinone biosynthesis C-methylase UbiE
MKPANQPEYGNWVSKRLIAMSAAAAAVLCAADAAFWLFIGGLLALKIAAAVAAAFFIVCAAYFAYARRLFSPAGEDIQRKVLDVLISHIHWNGKGKALDIGCGSGALAVRIAKRYPRAAVTGLDYWGAQWSYGKAQCETNAALEGVNGRTEFIRGSASKLPFADGSFDLVVSNLTFHEVKDSKNKLDVVREALRVVKPDGKFVFQDLFMLKSVYGTPDALVAAVKAAGAREAHFEITSTAPFIPRALKLPFMLGAAGVLRGVK